MCGALVNLRTSPYPDLNNPLDRGPVGAPRALCPRFAASRLPSIPGSHGSQGPELCTRCCFEWIMHASVGGWFAGVFPG